MTGSITRSGEILTVTITELGSSGTLDWETGFIGVYLRKGDEIQCCTQAYNEYMRCIFGSVIITDCEGVLKAYAR